MLTFTLSLTHGSIYVRQWGTEGPLLIVLPGYGYDGSVVEPLLPHLQQAFTVCAVDLPFHGQSQWQNDYCTRQDMRELITTLAKRLAQERFSLLGHSFGGRIATCLAADLAARLDHLILLAPAGIGSYTLVYPRFLQRLLEKLLRRPAWLRLFVRAGHRLGWFNNFHRRYAEVHLYPEEQRFRLFRVWNSLPEFQPEQTVVRAAMQQLPLPILLVLGQKDRLIPNQEVRTYYEQNERTRTVELDAGHNLFIPATGKAILQQLS